LFKPIIRWVNGKVILRIFSANLTSYALLLSSIGFVAISPITVSPSNGLHILQLVSAIEILNDKDPKGISLQPYENSDHQLKVNYPAHWKKIENPSDNASVVTFVSKSNNSNEIGIAIALYDRVLPYANLSSDFTKLQIDSLAKNFKILNSSVGMLASCPSHELVYENQTQGIRAMQAWSVKHDTQKDHVYLILYMTDASKFSNYFPLVRSVIGSLETTYDINANPAACS
jgi:hypothetical protein